jgi:hypothetical protein
MSEPHPTTVELKDVAQRLSEQRVSILNAAGGTFYEGGLTAASAWKVFDFLYAHGFEVRKR